MAKMFIWKAPLFCRDQAIALLYSFRDSHGGYEKINWNTCNRTFSIYGAEAVNATAMLLANLGGSVTEVA